MKPLSPTFWEVIRSCKGNPDALQPILESKSNDEVAAFGREFYQGLINLNSWDLWGAGYVMSGGMSDDSFHYFRSWILGKGQEAYETALNSPDDLAKFADDDDDFDNELLEYVAVEVLESRGAPDPRDVIEESPDDTPSGEEWEEDDLPTKFPKLAKLYWSD